MYIYDFLKDNEHAINEREHVLVSRLGKNNFVNIILTNKKLLFFSKSEYNSHLNSVPVYRIVLSLNLDNLNYHIEDNSTIISFNSNVFQLYDFDLDEFIML